MLKINNISKSFKDKKVLDNLSLVVNDSSIFGLVGVNGAGKSTLLRCVSGIYKSDKGNVELDGVDTFLNEDIRRDIFFVSDDPFYPMSSNIRALKEFYSTYYVIDEDDYRKRQAQISRLYKRRIACFRWMASQTPGTRR